MCLGILCRIQVDDDFVARVWIASRVWLFPRGLVVIAVVVEVFVPFDQAPDP